MKDENSESVARKLVAAGKGILAADESLPTIEKRLKSIDVASTEENRRAYREVLFTTAGVGEFISGVILFDETIRQKTSDGRTFERRCGCWRRRRGLRELAADNRSAGNILWRGDRDRRENSYTKMHRDKRRVAGALRGTEPGSGFGADRRTGSAHGWRAHY